MNKLRYILPVLAIIFNFAFVMGQESSYTLTGTAVDSYTNMPLEGVVVSVLGSEISAKTDGTGSFVLEGISPSGEISVWYPGYYTNVMPIVNRDYIKVVMIPDDKYGYAENMLLPFSGITNIREKQSNLQAIQKSNISLNKTDVDQAFVNIPGLELISKSGTPGEGNYFSIRGVNSFIGNNNPLIVINGVPYMPDANESGIIGGYSKNIFSLLNVQDVENITVLKGADAALYGSMGSNGVIMIETDKAVDLDTKVEFLGQYGIAWNQATLPVMGVDDYKSYISNEALTKYEDMADVLYLFPFLIDQPEYQYNYKYNNNTDWQDKIYTPAFTTDNVLKIKGGDAIAKYDFSIGYQNKGGIIKETNFSKYYARLGADVNLSKKVSLFSTISFGYSTSRVSEQGILPETNPILAALKKGPLFSPYEKDENNNLLPGYAVIRDADGNLIENNSVSNPLSVVKDVLMKEHSYDVLLNAGLLFNITDNFNIKGVFGVNYNLKQEDVFVPGASTLTIMPLSGGVADNTVRTAEGTTFNIYYNLNANYSRSIANLHHLKASVGTQVVMNKNDYNAGSGYNTANDYYKTLNNVSSSGRLYYGYNEEWNWLNFNALFQYNYNHQAALGLKMSVDGSSSVGADANRYAVYPAINAVWYSKNSLLENVDFINKLNVRAEYFVTGNSRYSSKLSKYYYQNKVFRNISGLVRAGVPNTQLQPEKTNTFNVGLDLSLWNNKVDLTFDYYSSKSSDLIMPVSASAAAGVEYIYKNAAKASNSGIELGMQLALVENRNFRWYLGGTIAMNTNEITSLGKEDKLVLSLGDGSAVISEVGQPMYSFYGYQTAGVFATDAAVIEAGKGGAPLKNQIGVNFAAGDICFVDQNGDGVIDENDRVKLGNANPDFYGNLSTTFQYKGFELSARFAYSKGNKMYNAVRRNMESMSDFSNQLTSVTQRWMSEGQITTVPRAVYGDPMENNRFSDRWIEDASYIKLKELMLSYKFNLFAGTTVFVAAENLFTLTEYLGLDPETMYSYDASLRGFDYAKVANPRSVKVGVKLQF